MQLLNIREVFLLKIVLTPRSYHKDCVMVNERGSNYCVIIDSVGGKIATYFKQRFCTHGLGPKNWVAKPFPDRVSVTFRTVLY